MRVCVCVHVCALTCGIADIFQHLFVKVRGEIDAQERNLLIVLIYLHLCVCVVSMCVLVSMRTRVHTIWINMHYGSKEHAQI